MRYLFLMLFFIMAVSVFAQDGKQRKLFNKPISLQSKLVVEVTPITENHSNYSLNAPIFKVTTNDRLPVFCAFEKRLNQALSFPVKVRLDDRQYGYK